jgi:hypothetical protein
LIIAENEKPSIYWVFQMVQFFAIWVPERQEDRTKQLAKGLKKVWDMLEYDQPALKRYPFDRSKSIDPKPRRRENGQFF